MKKTQLVKSTSGIRGVVGSGLDPVLVAVSGPLLRKGSIESNVQTGGFVTSAEHGRRSRIFESGESNCRPVTPLRGPETRSHGAANRGKRTPTHTRMSLSELMGTLPRYFTTKSKAVLPDDFRFGFSQGRFQLRRSNTEPIYRLIVETTSEKLTSELQRRIAGLFK